MIMHVDWMGYDTSLRFSSDDKARSRPNTAH